MNNAFFKQIALRYPDLALRLRQANMRETPEFFVKKISIASLNMTIGILVIVLGFVGKSDDKSLAMIAISFAPLILLMLFFYYLHIPDVKTIKIQKAIASEIVFAGRFLIIEIRSGVNLYEAMINVTKNFPEIGKSFRNITNKITLGTPTEEAINEEIENTPSDQLRKILWQIVNSLKTGADISQSLESVLQQMVRQQVIEVNEYGKKLNPLAMFYMMIAVILPSIGIAMFIVLSTFISLNISLGALIAIAAFLGFMQFMFIAIIKGQRPAVEL